MNFIKITDHNSLTEFYRQNGLEVSDDIVAQDGAFFSVASYNGDDVTSAATLSRRLGCYILDYIAVAKEMRGTGLGKGAMSLVFEKLRELGSDKVYITAKTPSFFEGLGFKNGSPDGVDMNADCIGCPEYHNGCEKRIMYFDLKWLDGKKEMERNKFLRLKAGLLCFGAALTDKAREAMMQERPKLFKKGFIDAVNMNVNGSNICVSVAEDFAEKSQFLLDRDDKGYFINFENERADVRFFRELPKTGTIVDTLATLHADGCINIWPSTNCCYDMPELKCKFCSLLPETNEPISVKELCEGLKLLLSEYYGTLNFSGATYKNPDRMVEYWCELCSEIRKFSDCPIAVEFAPPKNLDLIEKLKESGATVAIMNIEIVSKDLRKEICPGKSGITLEHYHKALSRAVEVFGHGKVSSVMIGGIQPWDDVKRECEILCEMGVFPTIMPFRPLDDCTYSFNKSCDPDELIKVSEFLGELLRKHKLAPQCQPGCTECGGCSIENDCYLK